MSKPLIYKRWPPQHEDQIQLYSLGTPNGLKASIALEEMGLSYEAHIVDIMKGDQHTEEFKSVNPNSKIPAIIDPNGPHGKAVSIMESGAILVYLAEKSGRLMPSDPVEKNECLQWLFFQVGHIGPMFGQFGHFYKFAADQCKDPYPKERYQKETQRLLAVLEKRLENRDFLLGSSYSIADIATFPWVSTLSGFYEAGEYLGLSNYENVGTWVKTCTARPSYEKGKAALNP
ncbi:MAG: glutathione S-transferase N-terminal domain-containing protein [SAR324 cluster bacterium]|nr:glutathione S-transferase N-terminal domain-containing protein [SAR324 cluster bacterium]